MFHRAFRSGRSHAEGSAKEFSFAELLFCATALVIQLLLVIPAKAGIQAIGPNFWIPAGAGMTHSGYKDQWPRSPR